MSFYFRSIFHKLISFFFRYPFLYLLFKAQAWPYLLIFLKSNQLVLLKNKFRLLVILNEKLFRHGIFFKFKFFWKKDALCHFFLIIPKISYKWLFGVLFPIFFIFRRSLNFLHGPWKNNLKMTVISYFGNLIWYNYFAEMIGYYLIGCTNF